MTDNQPTLSIGAIAIDPHAGSPYTIYVGTGEANNNGDAYWGDGILKSSDGGSTWTLLGTAQFGGLGIARIAVDPNNSSNVLVATSIDSFTTPSDGAGANLYKNMGIWQSTDGGSTWTEVLTNSNNSASSFLAGSEVVFDPAHAGVAYAALVNPYGLALPSSSGTNGVGIYRSTTSGNSWSLSWSNGSLARASIAVAADGEHVYAVATCDGTSASCASDSSGRYGELAQDSILLSTNGGTSWSDKAVPAEMAEDGPYPTTGGGWAGEFQWWYESSIGIAPSDSTYSTVYVGGVNLWQTTDGGNNWTDLSNTYGYNGTWTQNSGWDNHAIAFVGSSSTFYTGSDAGIMMGTGSGSTVNFTNRDDGGLAVTQYYAGSQGYTGASGNSQLWGGAQDVGTSAYPAGPVNENGPAVWNQQLSGDGTGMVVDWNNNNWVYTEFQYGLGVYSTDNGQNPLDWYCLFGSNTQNQCLPIDGDATNWAQPLIESAGNHAELLTATDRVYRTLNADSNPNTAPTWTAISPILDDAGSFSIPISALAVAASNDNYVYAGDDNGNIYYTSNANASSPTWNLGTVSNQNLSAMVTGLAVDPTNPKVAYATYNEFTPSGTGGEHVFKTTNAGSSWTDISASLPNVPFESIAVSSNNHNLVFAGSDAGVFDSPDGGSTWYQTGTGLPNAAIDQIWLNHNSSQLFVATHGRGMWEPNIPHIAPSPPQFGLATVPGSNPAPQTLAINNSGVGTLNWTLSGLPSWIQASATSGSVASGGPASDVTLTFNIPTANPAQTYNAVLQISDPSADNSPVSVPVTVVSASASTQWYFAEGYTGGTFTTLFTVANPGPSTAHLNATYNIQGGSPVSESYSVPAHSRSTININNDSKMGKGKTFSTSFSSDQPVVIERPMYFTYSRNGKTVEGGFDTMGATGLASTFDFGYLDSTANHTTLYTILNPTSATMYVNMAFYAQGGGSPIQIQTTVNANSRGTVNLTTLQPTLPAGIYSGTVLLTSDATGTTPVNGLVERPMYIVNTATSYHQSACVIGVPQASKTWDFAEGYTGNAGGALGQFNASLVLAYPTTSSGAPNANVTVTFMVQGGSPVQETYQLSPNTLQMININKFLANKTFSIGVSSDQAILAERLLSFNDGQTDVMGTTAPTHEYLFAEGYTSNGFETLVTLQNPDPSNTAYITLTLLPQQSGASPVVRDYVLGPQSRTTVNINLFYAKQTFSEQVISNIPIVAERPMYFNYGGTDVLGYQPPGS